MLLTREHTHKSQMGFAVSQFSPYTQGAGDINFANGQMIFIRFPTILPPNATINSATVKFNYNVKNVGTTQQSLHQIRAHYSPDSPRLVPGINEWSARDQTSSVRQFTMMWTANQNSGGENQFWTETITSIIQEVVNNPSYRPGAYITLMMLCVDEQGSDMGIRANNDLFPKPRVTIDYTSPVVDAKHTVNMLENSEFNPEINALDGAGNLGYWFQNPFFGGGVDAANYGTMAVDTSFTRVPGVPTLRFTCGFRPSEDQSAKRTGPSYVLNDDVRNKAVFCGWVFVSTAVPATSDRVYAGDMYQGWGQYITDRGVWVPFCSSPLSQNQDYGSGAWWFSVGVKDYQPGWQFWISEPAIFRSDFRQMPFNGLTPDREPGIDHKSGSAFQQSSRVWTPRTYFNDGSGLRARSTWIKRADNILQLAEPVKGGPTMANLPTTQIQNYDSNKRISEY